MWVAGTCFAADLLYSSTSFHDSVTVMAHFVCHRCRFVIYKSTAEMQVQPEQSSNPSIYNYPETC